MYLGIIIFSTVFLVSTIKCASLQCKKNCANEFVTILHGSDKCNDCWRCPECQEGLGSSVACGTNVTNDTSIHCVECVSGVNFSDSNGIEQCQPCGLCDGKHERLVAECTPEMNVLCECQDGYYRNETNGECLPCASCCSTEFKGDIQHECLDDGGKITRKCKFNGQKQTICESIWTTTPDPSLVVSSLEPSKTVLTEIIPIRINFSEREGVLNASASKSPDHTNPTPNNTQDWPWMIRIAAIVTVVIYIVITIRYLFLSQKWKKTTSSSRSESSTCYSCRHPLLGAEDPPDHGIASQQSDGQQKRDVEKTEDKPATEKSGEPSSGQSTPLADSTESPLENRALKMRSGEQQKTEQDQADEQQEKQLEEVDDKPASEESGKSSSGQSTLVADSTASPLENLTLETKSGEQRKTEHCGFSGGNISQKLNPQEAAGYNRQVPKSFTCGLTNIHALSPYLYNSMDQPAKGAKWSALTQAEKYNTKMLDVPFLLLHRICLMLDIKRSDGNDIRQFANIVNITVQEFDCLEQMAKVKQVTSSEVILKEVFVNKTVGNFISIMEDMKRDDIISLINAWKENEAMT
ncbi:tumor necrosis factor receptor superfamily member 16-like isoform X2 [Montipora capricornis]|uniref:tumor necrosis factor receptor superfamily member 16-like isoform X2 n=1 Tax=Montipora capricornis TaxID=246305 RepID=UPI0035F1F8C9